MGKKYRRYKNSLEIFLASEKGKRFFNIFYSCGAAVVILGALFKINHYPYGGEIMMVGMITEALMFFISAFDLPAREYKWDRVYPALNRKLEDDDTENEDTTEQTIISSAGPAIMRTSRPSGKDTIIGESVTPATDKYKSAQKLAGNVSGGGTIIIGGGISGGGNAPVNGGGITTAQTEEVADATEKYAEQLNKMTANMEKFTEATESLTKISESLMSSFKGIADVTDASGKNTEGYISQMQNLNRNVAGLNTIYEVQLKGVSGQIHTIEEINAGLDRMKNLYAGSLVDSSIFKTETQRMAQQLAELNQVYARMLQAMTTNMNMGGGFGNIPNPNNPQNDK